MDKKSFRREVLAEIDSLPAEYISASDKGIRENFLNLPVLM